MGIGRRARRKYRRWLRGARHTRIAVGVVVSGIALVSLGLVVAALLGMRL